MRDFGGAVPTGCCAVGVDLKVREGVRRADPGVFESAIGDDFASAEVSLRCEVGVAEDFAVHAEFRPCGAEAVSDKDVAAVEDLDGALGLAFYRRCVPVLVAHLNGHVGFVDVEVEASTWVLGCASAAR